MNLWEISTTECDGDTDAIMRRGNVYQVANGYMGNRGTLDEHGPGERVAITLAGIFDRVGDAWREPVNAPNAAYTCVALDGVPLSATAGHVERHSQRVRFRNALHERETVFLAGGKRLTLSSRRFLSRVNPHLGVVQVTVQCDREANVTIRTGIDGNIWDINGPHLPRLQMERQGDCLLTQGRTHEAGKVIAVAEAAALPAGLPESHEDADGRNLRVIQFRCEAGRTYTFDKFFAVTKEGDPLDAPAPEAAVAMARDARSQGFDACLTAHDAEWEKRWADCDVTIEGDDDAQLALRYSILQLLMVEPVAGSANSIPARALSGQVYKGAVFWDTELFMFPFFLHTRPQAAVELLRYRIRTLDGARRKARSEGPGYGGAFYAWESQDTGDDACTYYNVGDPLTGRELRTHFRDKQVHISADVALAFWTWYVHTGDDALLVEGGAEVILECARFFACYAYYNTCRDRFEILDVVGPDEYHERVHNNAFTNQVVRETFRVALAVADHLRSHHPQAWQALEAKLEIADELLLFRELAGRLHVPEPDPTTGLIEQFEGYFKLRDERPGGLKERLLHPNEYLGASQGLAVPTQVIKQADVVMMLALFKSLYDREIVRANWEYYEPRTEHGSSLSACAYALVALEFGNRDVAYRYFLKTARVDLDAKHKLYAGTVYIGGSHPAANGGAWMVAVLGFGGVKADAEGLSIQPRLHPKWRRLRFSVACQGARFTVEETQDSVTVTADSGNSGARTLRTGGSTVSCAPGETVTVQLQGEHARPGR